MTKRPDPAASAALLAQGIDDALALHGVPPRPAPKSNTDDRGARFAAQARRAREAAEELVDVDRLTPRRERAEAPTLTRNNNTH